MAVWGLEQQSLRPRVGNANIVKDKLYLQPFRRV